MKQNKDFDIADEIFDELTEDKYIIRKEVEANFVKLVEVEIKSSDNPYRKEKGLYTTIEFTDLYEREVYDETKLFLVKYLTSFIKELTNKKKPSVLIVGIGNEEYSPDALGPKVAKKMIPTSHLHEMDYKSRVSCLIPGVMGVTGLESFTIVKGVLNETQFDLVIVIDALTTHSINRLNHVIQITDTGLVPGSGVNNHRKAFNKENLKVPLISIGIATVISLKSIYEEFILNIEIENKYKLKDDKNIVLTIKEIEDRIEVLTTLISDSLNASLNP